MAPERHLAAILSADVVGYSRMMVEDEQGTIQTLTAYRGLISNLVDDHHGRVVDSPGDNLLAEFPNALDAVQCAVEIQGVLRVRNQSLAENRQMLFRIGVHLGDITTEGDRIYGDGVNIAARLEALADPAGVCISGAVHEQVESRLDLSLDDLGEQSVKNIAKPVRVYAVSTATSATFVAEGKMRGRAVGAGIALVVLAIAAFSLWRFYPALPQSQSGPAIERPDEPPSIVVLPFDNISGDPEQEYFVDGLTEDLITDLSKISGLLVIARNSAFTYKGKPVRVEEVGRELGVRYVLEGSVRRSGDRVRVTAQLVDSSTGHHLWAERYDRQLDEIFALQDDVTAQIIDALRVELTEGEQTRLGLLPTDNLEAYDHALRAGSYLSRGTKAANLRAREEAERAIELDANFGNAYATLAGTYFFEWFNQWSEDPAALERAQELSLKAISLDDSDPLARYALFWSYWTTGRHEEALATAKKGVELNPNNAVSQFSLGQALLFLGRVDDALVVLERATRLDPLWVPPLLTKGVAYQRLGRRDDAISTFRLAITLRPDSFGPYLRLAAIYVEEGDYEKARSAAAEVRRLNPAFSVEKYRRRSLAIEDPARVDRIADALRQAGLPE